MEILLEYKGSRQQLQIADPEDVYETIEESLKTGWSGFLTLCSESGRVNRFIIMLVYICKRNYTS